MAPVSVWHKARSVSAVSAMLWKTMFDPRTGFVDYFLGAFHPAWSSLTWLNASVARSWAAIFVADSWKNIPFVAIILLAGLQVIPTDIYEAARIDDAAVVITSIPIALNVLFAQRRIVSGLTAGSFR